VLTILIQASPDAGAQIVGLVMFILMCVVGLVVYFIPTGIAMMRSHPNVVAIMVINFLLGWVCIGWIVALIWSLTAIDQSKTYR
jgi:hypothetical protein